MMKTCLHALIRPVMCIKGIVHPSCSKPVRHLYIFRTQINISLMKSEGQKALRFHQIYLNFCSEDEQRSYRFGTT